MININNINLIKARLYEASVELSNSNPTIFDFTYLSEIDRENNLIISKPDLIPCEKLKAEDMLVFDINGNIVNNFNKDSSVYKNSIINTNNINLLVMAEIYKNFPDVTSIVHTHSPYATAYAQTGRSIKPYGVTHAKYFKGTIPCTRKMTPKEISENYAHALSETINEAFIEINYHNISAVLVNSHGVFTWGNDSKTAVKAAIGLETIAMMSYLTEMITLEKNTCARMQDDLLTYHFNRKTDKQ